MEQGREVVLTYRPEQSAEPVVLRYERELPCRMRREREEQSRGWQRQRGAGGGAAGCGSAGPRG